MNLANRFDKLVPDVRIEIPPEMAQQAARTLQAGERALAAQERTHEMIQTGLIVALALAAVYVLNRLLRG